MARNKSGDMTLLEHLGELRRRLSVVALAIIVVAFIAFQYTELIMQYLLMLNPGMELVYISPSELFLVYIQLSFIVAFIVCSPITAYELWAYFSKGLYVKERIYVFISMTFGLAFFALGVYFCYVIVLPTTLQFFVRISHSDIRATISIQQYASFINVMLVCFGSVFEMPVLSFLFSKLGILKPGPLKKNRGLLIVVLAVISAIITPPDVISQMLLLVPMLALMELSIIICNFVNRKQLKKEALS